MSGSVILPRRAPNRTNIIGSKAENNVGRRDFLKGAAAFGLAVVIAPAIIPDDLLNSLPLNSLPLNWLPRNSLPLNSISASDSPQTVEQELTLNNSTISLTFNSGSGTIKVVDLRTNRIWNQAQIVGDDVAVKQILEQQNDLIHMTLRVWSGLEIDAVLRLEENTPEFTMTLSSSGNQQWLEYPHPFESEKGTYLVVPMNEGISYPVDDPTIEPPASLDAYAGDGGICMPFWGVTDGENGYMAIIETPDDASIRIHRLDGNLCIAPQWDSQKGQFGTRTLRYVFFEKGGHVAMCKRYRDYALQLGLLKTLRQKLQERPKIDLLVGAVDVWTTGDVAIPIIKDMKSLGIQRIMWTDYNACKENPDWINGLNELGVLISRYDMYQEVMDPKNCNGAFYVHDDWPEAAWPDDIIIGSDGNWEKGDMVTGNDGNQYFCGTVCDMQIPKYAMTRIPDELRTYQYGGRFIDTATATHWNECYSPNHPVTRSESRNYRTSLLQYVSRDMGLVTGSETGHDAAVPYVDYFEGMLSLVPYRVDTGNLFRIWTDPVPEEVTRFQVGHQYRLPLWELVYHDCVVSTWWWGDYNNKIPAIWDKRDLFNILYGSPPMFLITSDFWESNKQRFAQTYQNVCTVVRAVGYEEMTDHQFLTADRAVQQTRFANGARITVNFGASPYSLPGGTTVPPMGYHIDEPTLSVMRRS